MTTEPTTDREELRAFAARHGITAEAQRITREAFAAAVPGRKLGRPQRDRTYWMVTIRREGATPFVVPYSLGSSAWWDVRGAEPHRRRGEAFMARCSGTTCDTLWPCDATLRSKHPDAQPTPPDAADVLDSMHSDAIGYEDARDFEDWCGEYGYDTDSRRAERMYNAIAEQTKQLRRFLGDAWASFLDAEGL